MSAYAKRKILGAVLGNCVHVAGTLGFLKLAEDCGYETRFLGPAVSVNKLVEGIMKYDPDIIALGYRLTPTVAEKLLTDVKHEIEKNKWAGKVFVFGGTPPVADVAHKTGLFDAVFSGLEPLDDIVAFLKGSIGSRKSGEIPPQNLIGRIKYKESVPLIRHHFGQPTIEETIKGAKEIALAEVIDVLSLGPDQNAQECFFRPQEMKMGQDGAGGVPLRKPGDLKAIYSATRCGNYPIMRCYSGTRDLIKWAKMSKEAINIAWGAVPLFWYNQLDGRSDRIPIESINENQEVMRWYAEQKIPLEVNESHQWSLREAPDTVAVAVAFLAAYNAKKCGIRHYVAQYMFNTPVRTSPPMDLAKMLAKIELIEALHDKEFTSIRQTRTGLASLSPEPDIAKGQLAASTYYQLALQPKIVHVVSFCEGDHAATPEDIVVSSRIVEGVIRIYSMGSFDIVNEDLIKTRKEKLVEDAKLLLENIKKVAADEVDDPWTDPGVLSNAIKVGLFDAPHLRGNPHAVGQVFTRMRGGACVPVDLHTGETLSEKERIARILKKFDGN